MFKDLSKKQLNKSASWRTSFANWSFNSSGGSTNINQSNLVNEASNHRIQVLDTLLPVAVIEAISNEFASFKSLSVRISDSGWMWIVSNRRLFVWKYAQNQSVRMVNCPCFELQLPQSDLLNKADLVSLIHPISQAASQTPGVIAVSPEGTIRFWPNIAYQGHSVEITATDLQGQECYSLTNIQPLGCILGTTTSSLAHVIVNLDGSSLITCRPLKIPQGMLRGFGRKVSSFIFGANPTSQSYETKQLVKVLKDDFYGSGLNVSDQYIYVLAGCVIQKWNIVSSLSERLVFEYDLDRIIRDSFLDKVWNRETTHHNQLQIWPIDIALLRNDQLVVLVAGLNTEVSNQLYYALGSYYVSEENPSNLFSSFTVLRNHTVCYVSEDEENLTNLKLLIPSNRSPYIYAFNHSKILCIQFGSDVVDVIDLNRRDDGILGAGISDGLPLVFTYKDALASIIPIQQEGREPIGIPKIEIDLFDGQEPGLKGLLKQAFSLYMKRDLTKSEVVMTEINSLIGSPYSDEIDEAVIELSSCLSNDMPRLDPRWSESTLSVSADTSSMAASVIIFNQLEEKLKIQCSLIEFLKAANLWDRLTTTKSPTQHKLSATQLVLCEHIEKLIGCLTLKKLHSEHDGILDAAIRLVLNNRNTTIPLRLTSQDVFYRETTKIDELIPFLLQLEENQIYSSSAKTNDAFILVISVANILLTLCQEVCRYRQTQSSLYDVLNKKLCEYSPWTSSTGPKGMRTCLIKQIDFLIDYTGDSKMSPSMQDDMQIKSLIYQKLIDLSDVILDGYVCQLKSLDQGSERYLSVLKSFEADRAKCLSPLIRAKQYERATSLAEKYEDFDCLITICEELDNKDRLQRYIAEFEQKGFADRLFHWYLQHGKQGKLLSTSIAKNMNTILSSHAELNCLNQIHLNQFEEAGTTLKNLAAKETTYLSKKKTLLSLSKLASLAAGNGNHLADVDDQLDLVDYQETLPVNLLESYNFDADTTKPLTPRELLQLYVSDANIDANKDDYRKAQKLLKYVDDGEMIDSVNALKLRLEII